MNKELLEKRISEIEKAIQQGMANVNMLMGGKEECLYWLSQLNASPSLDPGMELHELKKALHADSIEIIKNAG